MLRLSRRSTSGLLRGLLLGLTVFLLYSVGSRLLYNRSRVERELRWIDELNRKTGNDTGGCRVPVLDPWDSSILKYYAKQDPLKCTPVQKTQVVQLRDGRLFIDPEEASSVGCEFRTISHKDKDDFNAQTGDWTRLPSRSDGFPMPADAIEVQCRKEGLLMTWPVFSRSFTSVVPRNVSSRTNRPFLDASPEHPRVVMLGLDSMSRSNFYRQMPRTLDALRKRGAIEFLRHVKVADNTYSNWISILTGKRGVTTREFKAELNESWNVVYDDFPFVWKDFASQGYATLFAEDAPTIATFNYLGKSLGFFEKPTDHYMRPYYLTTSNSMVLLRSTVFCYDSDPVYDIQLQYLSSFLTGYANKRLFAWYWTQEASHDFLNAIGQTDGGFARFISGPLFDDPNTILIVFSDHGHRYDRIRDTLVGRLESRLPFLSIVIPKQIRDKHPEVVNRLRQNAEGFSTQFDLYQTLIDIANGTWLERHDKADARSQRGHSNFAVKPANRTCYEAQVPAEFCPCFTEVTLNPVDGIQPAVMILEHVNGLLARQNAKKLDADHPDGIKPDYKCALLSLHSVQFASVRVPPRMLIVDPQVDHAMSNDLKLVYRIALQADAPSRAQLEAEIEHNIRDDVWAVLGDVERNNRYGNTSHCVTDSLLKKLCHCEEGR